MLRVYKTKAALNIKKLKGLVDRIEKMIEKDEYCMSIAQQCNAGIGLLRQVNNLILESHLHTCGAQSLNSKNKIEKEKFIKELIRVCNVTNR